MLLRDDKVTLAVHQRKSLFTHFATRRVVRQGWL
jgi:hypothetical protein